MNVVTGRDDSKFYLELYCDCGDTAIHGFVHESSRDEAAALFKRVHFDHVLLSKRDYCEKKRSRGFKSYTGQEGA